MHLPRWELDVQKVGNLFSKGEHSHCQIKIKKNFCFTFALSGNWFRSRCGVLFGSEWEQKAIKCYFSNKVAAWSFVALRHSGWVYHGKKRKPFVLCLPVNSWGLFSEKLRLLLQSLMLALSRCLTALRWRLPLRCAGVPVGSSTMSSRPATTARPQFLTQTALFHRSTAKASPDPNKITSGKGMLSQLAVHCYTQILYF